ncbi:MAG: hypothetical protein NUV77_06290 [Thermoguttaceae bacterium]|nr:hypothetical protein [Thermoguttaceae bacterium]
MLQQAILHFESRRSVSARIWQRVELFGKQLEGSGTYLEQRSDEGLQLRLELKFPLEGDPCVVLQVSSGRYLWKYEKFRDTPRLARIDTARVLRALQEKGDPPVPGKIGDWPGWGGIGRLLRGLNATFAFTQAEPATLTGGFPVFRLEGRWRPERLRALFPEQAGGAGEGRAGDLDALPPHVPHYVVVYLGRDDLFPYRTEYHRLGASSPAASRPTGDSTIAVMELREVTYNAPIAREQFYYDPGTLEYSEQTDQWLESLGAGR